MNQQLLMLPGISPDELAMLQEIMKDMSENQQQQFFVMYSGKRKDRQTMLLICLAGLVGFAGIHRMMSGDVVLGIIYFLTLGFCFIGTIIDAVNINNFTYEFNRKQAIETAQMVRVMVR